MNGDLRWRVFNILLPVKEKNLFDDGYHLTYDCIVEGMDEGFFRFVNKRFPENSIKDILIKKLKETKAEKLILTYENVNTGAIYWMKYYALVNGKLKRVPSDYKEEYDNIVNTLVGDSEVEE